jgi:serine/threonine-protein kinase RsbW
MERTFQRSFDSLNSIFAYLEKFFSAEGIAADHQYALRLAIEELFTNMVKYQPGNPNEILLDLRRLDDRVEVSLTDFDVDPFDITKVAEVRVDRPVEQRRPGGLGIHLIKKMIDRIDYEYVGRRSKTTFIKMLE